MGFENKVAIVTGGAMGNGLGIVKVLAEKGAKISILDYSDTVETTVSDLKKQGYDVIGFKVDIRNKPEVKKCVDATFEKFGRLDILFNNAGVLKCEPFLEMSDELRDFHLDVNVKGPWNVTQCALPYMIKNHYGRVVTISSVTGEYVGDAGDMAYGTSKAALIGFAKCLAMEVADKGITSNVLCPGYILTPMVEQLAKDTNPDDPESVLKIYAEGMPVQRLGRPADIGHLVAFLASEEAGFITGASIVIDGGCILPETKAAE